MTETIQRRTPLLPSEDEDVVTLLTRQHGEIRDLFDEVENHVGDRRREAFRRLARTLAIHETAEQEIVHPQARAVADGGDAVVEERLAEEEHATELLARLDALPPDATEFLTTLHQLRTDVTRHARAEERYEFAQLRRHTTPERLAALARAVKTAAAVAPTPARPGATGGPGDAAEEPVTELLDRVRQAVRRAMTQHA